MKLISTKDVTQDGVKLLVYGASGAGKTTLIATAPNPFIISSERGLLSLSGHDIPAAEIKTEEDLEEVYEYVLKSKYDTICLDSISDIAESILSEYKGRFTDGRQAYGLLNDTISKYIRKFRALKNKNVYFTAKEGKTEESGVVVAHPNMPGKTLTVDLPYFFDCVLRLEADKKGARVLHSKATFTQTCKDRSGKLEPKEAANLTALFDKIIGAQHGNT